MLLLSLTDNTEQAGFRKGRGTRDQLANICWIIEKARYIGFYEPLIVILRVIRAWWIKG